MAKQTCGASVVHGDVAEQIRHGLSVVDAANGFGQDHAHVHRFDFGTLQLLQVVGHSVGHHHLQVQSDSCIITAETSTHTSTRTGTHLYAYQIYSADET